MEKDKLFVCPVCGKTENFAVMSIYCCPHCECGQRMKEVDVNIFPTPRFIQNIFNLFK